MLHTLAWSTVVVLITVALMATAAANAQSTWYVDDDAPGDPGPGDPTVSDPQEDGTAAHPFDAIQEGVNAAVNGDTVQVRDGSYTGVGNRDVDLSGRLITVRSENGPDTCVIDCQRAGRAFFLFGIDSTGTVVEGLKVTNGRESFAGAMSIKAAGRPKVSGCVFLGNSSSVGGALYVGLSHPEIIGCDFIDNTGDRKGGAIYVEWSCKLTMRDCLLSGNSVGSAGADDGGGAVYIDVNAETTITRCSFEGHSAKRGGAVYNHGELALTTCTFADNTASFRGGAIYDDDDAMTMLRDCTFVANSADEGGGGVYNYYCDATVIGSTFSRNHSFCGGAMFNYFGNQAVTNCHFNGNTAHQGGAISNTDSVLTITNASFSGNAATDGGGVMVYGSGSPALAGCTFCANEASEGSGLLNVFGTPALTNCVMWGDSGGEIVNISGTATVTYSDIHGGYAGDGNIDVAPLFVSLPDPGPDGEWGTEDDDYGDLRIQPDSPCIDAADNTAVPADEFDLDGDGDSTEPTPYDLGHDLRFVNDPDTPDTGFGDPPVVDMGAYEFQAGICRGDLNCDGWIGFGDINPFILALSNWDVWKQRYPDCPQRNADINGDGQYGGQFGFGDINPMVHLLASGQGQPIPCD